MLAKLSFKITFVMPSPNKNNDEDRHLSARINKEKLSSEVKEEYLSVDEFSEAFAPKIRLGDLYFKRLPSGKNVRTDQLITLCEKRGKAFV